MLSHYGQNSVSYMIPIRTSSPSITLCSIAKWFRNNTRYRISSRSNRTRNRYHYHSRYVFPQIPRRNVLRIIGIFILGAFFIIIYILRPCSLSSDSNRIENEDEIEVLGIPKVIHIVHRFNLCDHKMSSDRFKQITNQERCPYIFDLSQNVQRIKAWNPEYEVKCYDEEMASNYIKAKDEEFDTQYASYYDDQEIHRRKADLFRSLLLFHEGGVVMDPALEPMMSLEDLLESVESGNFQKHLVNSKESEVGDHHPTFWSIINSQKEYLITDFIASTKKHPILKLNLKILENRYVLNLGFPKHAGGVMLTEAVRRFTNQHDLIRIQRENENIHLLNEERDGMDGYEERESVFPQDELTDILVRDSLDYLSDEEFKELKKSVAQHETESAESLDEHLVERDYTYDDEEYYVYTSALNDVENNWDQNVKDFVEQSRIDNVTESKIYDQKSRTYPFLSRSMRYDTEYLLHEDIVNEVFE